MGADEFPVYLPLPSTSSDLLLASHHVANSHISHQTNPNYLFDHPLTPTQNPSIRQFLLTNLVRPAPDSPSRQMKWRIPLELLSQQLDAMGDFPMRNPDETRFCGPSLFVRGTRSPYVADEALPVIGRYFPRFEARDVEAGHWLISENPEGFREGEFLDLIAWW